MPEIDPENLASVFFGDGSAEEDAATEYYVNPKLVLRCDSVLHGRGLVTKEAIKKGECLFVTPPLIAADKANVKDQYLQNKGSIEEYATQSLVDGMMAAARNGELGKINSYMSLLGMPAKSKHDKQAPSIETLLGRSNDELDTRFCDDPQAIQPDHLRKIIERNAFGPDFITYSTIQRMWDTVDDSYIPHHMLGLYPLAASTNHACNTNAVRTFVGETMVAHASSDLPAGSEILWSYIPLTQPFKERRKMLKRQHKFICKCDRCELESEYMKPDRIPSSLTGMLESASKWNDSMVDISANTGGADAAHAILVSFPAFDDLVTASTHFPNELKRYLRVSYANFHLNFFNAILAAQSGSNNAKHKEMVLKTVAQLHFAFCVSDMASTMHLSILHLCYELSSEMHRSASASTGDSTKTANQVKFWTEQLKNMHNVRYGHLGADLETMRKLMVHSRTLLRQRDGFRKTPHRFI